MALTSTPPTRGAARQIGPVGTAGRVALALLAIGLPVGLDGIGWPEAAIALAGLPLLITVVARLILAAFPPGDLDARGAASPALACLLVGLAFGATALIGGLTPIDGDVAFWVWLGTSMLLAAARGYAGCEALAFPNVLTGRRDAIGCPLFTPIDTAEAHHRAR